MRSPSENIIYYTTKEKFIEYEKRVRKEYIIPHSDEKISNLGFQNLLYKGCPILYFDEDVVLKKADL